MSRLPPTLLLIALASCGHRDPTPSAEARAAEHRERVVARARLQPRGGVVEVAGPAGDRVGKLLVKERDRVELGTPLAYTQSYDTRMAEQRLAAERLDQARAQLLARTEHGSGLVAKARLMAKRIKLQELAASAQAGKVERAEAEAAQAEAEASRQAALADKAVVTKHALERARLEAQRREEELASSRSAQAELDIQLEMARKEAYASIKMARAQATLDELGATVGVLEKELEVATARIEEAVVRAPISGEILQIPLAPGESMSRGPVVKMGATDDMEALAEVYETDIRWVKPGQRVSIGARALPEALEGTVVSTGVVIGSNRLIGDDPTARKDARVFEVHVKLASSEVAARFINLEVQARIEVAGR